MTYTDYTQGDTDKRAALSFLYQNLWDLCCKSVGPRQRDLMSKVPPEMRSDLVSDFLYGHWGSLPDSVADACLSMSMWTTAQRTTSALAFPEPPVEPFCGMTQKGFMIHSTREGFAWDKAANSNRKYLYFSFYRFCKDDWNRYAKSISTTNEEFTTMINDTTYDTATSLMAVTELEVEVRKYISSLPESVQDEAATCLIYCGKTPWDRLGYSRAKYFKKQKAHREAFCMVLNGSLTIKGKN